MYMKKVLRLSNSKRINRKGLGWAMIFLGSRWVLIINARQFGVIFRLFDHPEFNQGREHHF